MEHAAPDARILFECRLDIAGYIGARQAFDDASGPEFTAEHMQPEQYNQNANRDRETGQRVFTVRLGYRRWRELAPTIESIDQISRASSRCGKQKQIRHQHSLGPFAERRLEYRNHFVFDGLRRFIERADDAVSALGFHLMHAIVDGLQIRIFLFLEALLQFFVVDADGRVFIVNHVKLARRQAAL